MNSSCMKWRDQLLETALGEPMASQLEAHLAQCADCAAELRRLRARREKLDAMLPLIAAAEPSPDLRARILTAAQSTRTSLYAMAQRWVFAGAATLILIAATIEWVQGRRTNVPDRDLEWAQELAQWYAPTDVLLQLPSQQFLNNTPRLGESYLSIPVKTRRGESK